MTEHDQTERAAARLKDALTAAADVMTVADATVPHAVPDAPGGQHVKRTRRWLFPLAAAASVVVIILAAVLAAHLSGPSRAGRAATSTGRVPRPEFYMTAAYSASGPNVLRLQVRRTAGGAVTASTSIPAASLGWGGYLAAAANDRAFFLARYPCSGTATPVTTFYRITITGSGAISAIAPAGRPVQGKVTELAVSPDGSQMAYNALPGACAGPGSALVGRGTVSIVDLPTGAVRTWQDAAPRDAVSELSWAPGGRTLVVDEYAHVPGGPELTVYGLNTTSGGGSLQAHSTVLLQQDDNCSSCVTAALAGPDGSLTALETQAAGLRKTYLRVVSIPAASGSPRTVLFSELSDNPKEFANQTGLFADPSGKWVLLWPESGVWGPQDQQIIVAAGWISGDRLHPLPGVANVYPQGIAW